MKNDTIQKTLIVTLSLCIFCSILVSGSAVLLKPIQEKNKALDKKKNILATAGLLNASDSTEQINQIYTDKIQSALFDFKNNQLVSSVPAGYDQRKAAKDPKSNQIIEQDYAGIKTRAQEGLVYFVKNNGQTEQVILPIHGKGLWSTLYGFISLDKDLKTIKGISYYEHKETPGLGGEVDNPKWKNLWKGKLAFDDKGDVKIEVIKGQVTENTSNASYKVDGISGATITSRGVSNMLKYWLGQQAYGPFIKSLDLNALNISSITNASSQGETYVN